MVTQPKWHLKETVPILDRPRTLRELLEQQWLLPHRLVHYLRIRENVQLNGAYQPMNTLVTAGDRVDLWFMGDEFRTGESSYIVDSSRTVPVLFENEDLVVVNKPAGIKSHPNRSDETGTLMNFVAAYLAQQGAQPYMVHRIDQETSGAVIVAKNPVVVPILDRLISRHQIHRQYLAITSGFLTPAKGIIALPIGRDVDDPRKRRVNGEAAQSARTHYQVVAQHDNMSLVALQLETGRTHQIRVHLAASGAPIVGDPLYNDQIAERMLLHGAVLTLVVPFTQQKLVIKAPNPRYFEESIVKWHLK